MTTSTKADPVVEFLGQLLSGICSVPPKVIREGSQIYVVTEPADFGLVLGKKGKMWGAIKTCAFHAARLARVDPPTLTLITPDHRSEERLTITEFCIDWGREAFLEYLAPLLHAIVPGTPEATWATDDGESAKLRSVWPAEAKDRLASVPDALGVILASAGSKVGARITLEVQWE